MPFPSGSICAGAAGPRDPRFTQNLTLAPFAQSDFGTGWLLDEEQARLGRDARARAPPCVAGGNIAKAAPPV